MTAANVCLVAAWLTGIFGIYRALVVLKWTLVLHSLSTLFLASIWGFVLYTFSLWLVVPSQLPPPPLSTTSKQPIERTPTAAEIAEEVAKKLPSASKPKSQPRREPEPNLGLLPKIAEDVGEIRKQTAPKAPRRLSPAQKTSMLEVLSEHPGLSIDIVAIMGDGESDRYAKDFVEVFRAANWNLGGPRGYSSLLSTLPTSGIEVRFKDSNDYTAALIPVIEAVRAAGIEPKWVWDKRFNREEVKLYIGKQP